MHSRLLPTPQSMLFQCNHHGTTLPRPSIKKAVAKKALGANNVTEIRK